MSKKISNTLVFAIMFSLVFSILPFGSVFASDKTDEFVQDVDGMTITQTEDSLSVKDNENEDEASIVFEDKQKTKGIYTDSDGSEKEYYRDEIGNVFLDGEMVVEVTTDTTEEELSNEPTFSVMAEKWYHVTTHRMKMSTRNSAAGIMLGISSFGFAFIPGFGWFSATLGGAGVVKAIKDHGGKEAYYEIKQYRNSNYSRLKNVESVYRKSNYTGLIKRSTTYDNLR